LVAQFPESYSINEWKTKPNKYTRKPQLQPQHQQQQAMRGLEYLVVGSAQRQMPDRLNLITFFMSSSSQHLTQLLRFPSSNSGEASIGKEKTQKLNRTKTKP
jgi:hypothetical protein